jgi:uncharacterized protein (TIGR02147 family)
MNSIFETDNYRSYIKRKIVEMPKGGYGQFRKLADFLGVHTTLVSQIFSGAKNLMPDQAVLIAEFFGFTEVETEYFVTLVEFARASTDSLRRLLIRRLEEIKARAFENQSSRGNDYCLTEEAKAIFYSDWTYVAIWQLSAIPGHRSADKIAEYLGLPIKKINSVIEFLVLHRLCTEKDGQITVGTVSPLADHKSPWIRIHHANWREKAIGQLVADDANKVHFTSPMTLSKRDVQKIRELIIMFIEDANSVVAPSASEELYCLNIDWFKVR